MRSWYGACGISAGSGVAVCDVNVNKDTAGGHFTPDTVALEDRAERPSEWLWRMSRRNVQAFQSTSSTGETETNKISKNKGFRGLKSPRGASSGDVCRLAQEDVRRLGGLKGLEEGFETRVQGSNDRRWPGTTGERGGAGGVGGKRRVASTITPLHVTGRSFNDLRANCLARHNQFPQPLCLQPHFLLDLLRPRACTSSYRELWTETGVLHVVTTQIGQKSRKEDKGLAAKKSSDKTQQKSKQKPKD
ncbi:hypothetical protein B0H11DRAFT_2208844 [Mycena galericulata]|nr:hypothetical protein B0H11DRAFT_2208844 [Mycena galericulata]